MFSTHMCANMQTQSLQSCLSLCNPIEWSPSPTPRLLCPWGSPGKNTGVDCTPSCRGDLPNPRIEAASPESPALQANVYHWATGEALPHIYDIHVLKSLLFSPPVIPSNYSIKYLVTCTHQSDCNSSEGKKRTLSFHKIIYPIVHFALVKKKKKETQGISNL